MCTCCRTKVGATMHYGSMQIYPATNPDHGAAADMRRRQTDSLKLACARIHLLQQRCYIAMLLLPRDTCHQARCWGELAHNMACCAMTKCAAQRTSILRDVAFDTWAYWRVSCTNRYNGMTHQCALARNGGVYRHTAHGQQDARCLPQHVHTHGDRLTQRRSPPPPC